MQITLNQDEIFDALKIYVGSHINIAEGMEVSIDMKAGRADNGFSATLDIVPAKPVNIPSVTGAPVTAPTKTVNRAISDTPEERAEPEAPVEEKPKGKIFGKKPEPVEEQPDAVAPESTDEEAGADAPEASEEEAPAKPRSIFSKAG